MKGYVSKNCEKRILYTVITTLNLRERRKIRARSIVTEMKVKYNFANGDCVELEVEEKFGKYIENSRKRENRLCFSSENGKIYVYSTEGGRCA